jgi:hypothetical protein
VGRNDEISISMPALFLDRLLKHQILGAQSQGRYYLGSEKPGIHGLLSDRGRLKAFASVRLHSVTQPSGPKRTKRISHPVRFISGDLIWQIVTASPVYTSGSSVPRRHQHQRIRSPGRCCWRGRAVSQTSEASGYIYWLSGASTTLLAESTRWQ